MAYAEYPPATFDPTFLNANEQDLLTTALNSNKPAGAGSLGGRQSRANTLDNGQSNGDVYASPMDQPDSGNFDSTPYLDYDIDEANFDWDVDGQMIGDLPGRSEGDDETGDKRKSPNDEGSAKRRSSEDKANKKPGRKPLTSEPTSKRKAQNRAAQRAFRERKERHLKELESKVDDLEKASESANHENGLLRAQVERLQTELREYRKRLSVNNTPNRASTQTNSYNMSTKSAWDINNNFQFAFPRFNPFGAESTATGRNNSLPVTGSVPDANTGLMGQDFSTSTTALSNSSLDALSGLFPPDILKQAANSPDESDFGFNISPSTTAKSPAAGKSPAAASTRSKLSEQALSDNSNSPASSANNGFTSSCVTTPEYSAESPDQQRKASEAGIMGTQGTGRRRSSAKDTFCTEFAKACGNKENPVPPSLSESNPTPVSTSTSTLLPHTPTPDAQGFDWFATQNGGAFDPILFGDYRDPQENIMTGDYGGFFQDAFAMPDLGGEQPLGVESAMPKKRDLMKEIEDQQAGKESEMVPGEHPKQFLTCNMLWDRVQRSDRVKNGEADMDDLCTQLKAKAKCSGNGAVIDQKDVDAILGPAPVDTKDFFKMFK